MTDTGSSNEHLIISFPCSGLCPHFPLPSTEHRSLMSQEFRTPPTTPVLNLVHPVSDLILPCWSHPVPWVLALSKMHPELLAASRSFCSLIPSWRWPFFLCISWKKILSITQNWGFWELSLYCQDEYFPTSGFPSHWLIPLLWIQRQLALHCRHRTYHHLLQKIPGPLKTTPVCMELK